MPSGRIKIWNNANNSWDYVGVAGSLGVTGPTGPTGATGPNNTTILMWAAVPGSPTRASNTTFTVTGDYSSVTTYPFGKGTLYKWLDGGIMHCAMQVIPQTYSNPNTTFTIIGDVMAAIDAGTLKYATIDCFIPPFAYAGSIAATGADVMNAWYADKPYRVLGADLYVGTAGTTNNTTVDINKGGTTMFTTKPTLASTVAASPLAFTADDAIALALNDKITIDIDAIQTTPAVDLYVKLYLLDTRLLYLS